MLFADTTNCLNTKPQIIPKKVLIKTSENIAMGKGPTSPTTTVKGTVTLEQLKAIDALVGKLGSNRQDVVGKMLTMWLYAEAKQEELRQPKV
jgi:hypothetical protein